MSDEEEVPVEGEPAEAPARRKPPLVVIIAAAAVLVLALAGVGAFLMLGKKPVVEPEQHEAQGVSFEYGPHKDNNDENAQRAAALAKAAAEGGTPHTASPESAPAPDPTPAASAVPAAKAEHKAH